MVNKFYFRVLKTLKIFASYVRNEGDCTRDENNFDNELPKGAFTSVSPGSPGGRGEGREDHGS